MALAACVFGLFYARDLCAIPANFGMTNTRAEDPFTSEARAGDDARPHLVDERKHLVVVGLRILLDCVKTQRLWRAAATLASAAMKPGSDFIFCSCS